MSLTKSTSKREPSSVLVDAILILVTNPKNASMKSVVDLNASVQRELFVKAIFALVSMSASV